MEAQIQVGMPPQWHPYLFLIFFATLVDYNLHRLISLFTDQETLYSGKNSWVIENKAWFYALIICSLSGFFYALSQARSEVLYTLLPFAVLTLFYYLPAPKNKRGFWGLRQIPYFKIFLIALVWSGVTVMLPVVHAAPDANRFHVLMMVIERFLFVFAITIPFDVKDMEADREAGLQTIPMHIGAEKSYQLSIWLLICFFILSSLHYLIYQQIFMLVAFFLSFSSTLFVLKFKKIRSHPLYYYGMLDGTMLLQGLLVYAFYWCKTL
ncbi:MAG: UbiA family prenyltransferase [Saprospiraceae bacterium]|nr:UbiA family prenyltransferase [Saprospiraceae bacterium]